jgi:hypothetical protein
MQTVTRVYASLPLTGPAAGLGREVLRGAELALERGRGCEDRATAARLPGPP